MVIISFIFFFFLLFFFPEIFNHAINYVPANPLVTPSHIVPEWYFLPFYAILRSILNKTFGILAMFISMAILYILPILDSVSGLIQIYNYIHIYFFWFFFFNIFFLGFLGSQTAEYPCVELGLFSSIIHLIYFFFYKPIFSQLEKLVYLFYIHD